MWLFLSLACASCFELPPSDDDNTEEIPPPPDDDDTAEDSGETSEGPPELCGVTEQTDDTDRATDYDRIIDLPLETYACGNFDASGDSEWFSFTTTEAGWVKFDVQAAARGSSADPMYQLFMLEGGDESTRTLGRELSSDPWNVWLAPVPGTYNVVMGESSNDFGDDYRWWVVASVTKSPVDYGTTEEAVASAQGRSSVDHDSFDERLSLTVRPADAEESDYPKTRVLAHLAEIDEVDWWYIPIPEGATSLHIETDAWQYGSAADNQMDIYWDDDGVFGSSDDEHIWTDNYGHGDHDHDPYAEICTNLSEHTGIAVAVELDPAEQVTGGGMFHWYTIEAYAEYGESEEEACK